MSGEETGPQPPESWPAGTQEVFIGLKTYRIVGASACVAAIVRALHTLAADGGSRRRRSIHRELVEAGSLFCSLKPSTAAYLNVVEWLFGGLHDAMDAREVAWRVAERVESYTAYSRRSLERIVDETFELLAADGHVLIHDYSSTVLAIMEKAAQKKKILTVFVTAGEPVNQGPKVARAVAHAGHRLVYLPDAAIGRVMPEVDIVLSGVETLFRNGDLANTVGTYPIALVAREMRVPVYGVTERIKIHPTAAEVTSRELTAQVLHPWPTNTHEIPRGAEIRREVLDLTPAELITSYVTEAGVLPPSHVSTALEELYADLTTETSS